MEIAYYWFLASALFFLAEALGISGIGLLFAAIGAFCLGILLQTGLLSPENIVAQGALFFLLTAIWAAVLWAPIKKIRMKKSTRDHQDIVGRMAVVDDGGLRKGARGNARWSGTTMNARLADDAAINTAAAGDELKIVKVDGSTLVLAQKDYPTE